MIIKTDKDIIQSYLTDESGLLGGHAHTVYIPENKEEVVSLIKKLATEKVQVAISGSGTGVVGGRVPFGGAVISFEKLNQIIEFKQISSTQALVSAQAGITVKVLKEYANKQGWMYAPDPTEQNSTLGGNIATNASGSRGFKFGSTRKYVLGLTILLSTGEVLSIKRGQYVEIDNKIKLEINNKPVTINLPKQKVTVEKNAAGYFSSGSNDLIDSFIGSEGTLGIILEAELALLPDLSKIISGIAFFNKKEDAWNFVDEVRSLSKDRTNVSQGNIDALSIEYMDKNALGLLKNVYSQIPGSSEAAIFFEQEVNKENIDKITENWSVLLEKHKVALENVWFGANTKEQDLFRELRHTLPEKVNEVVRKNGFQKTGTDIVVPVERFREMLEYYYEVFTKSGIEYLVFGHIGECHMHANLLPKTQVEYEKCREIYADLVRKAVELGGTASGEHGIGKLKHVFLEIMIGNGGLAQLKEYKKLFDPSMILGQGNLFKGI